MVQAITQAIGAISSGITGAAASMGSFAAANTQFVMRAAAFAYTVIDALTNKQTNSLGGSSYSSPAYTFGQLQTQVSNLLPRPIIYGQVKIAGNKIWQTGTNTATIKQIICLCDGEINSISDVKFNDEDIAGLSGCSYDAYYGNGTQNIDSRVPGAAQINKAAVVGGLKYDAYLAITAQASKKISNSGFNVTCLVEGKKIRVYTNTSSYSTAYSNNPAWCILDFLTCYNGIGLSHSEIDIQSFIDAANYCNATVDGQARFALNLILDTKSSRLDWLNAMLLVCRGYLVYQDSKIYFKIDQSGSSSQSFDSSNIIAGTEKFWTTPRENKYDTVKIQFIDPDNEYARVYAVAELSSLNNEQPLVKTVEAFGITNFKQASRLGWFYLNEAATTNKFISFTTTKEGLDRTIGDIIAVTSTVMGYTAKLFRIISMNELQEGQIEITCKEYNSNLYNDTQGSVAPSIDVIASTNTFDTGITDITLQGDADNDQTRLLQLLIDNLSEGTGGTLNVDAETTGVYLNAALNVKSNVHVNFKCPVILGQYGQLRIYGGFYETPENTLPKLRSDLTAGTKIIYCGTQAESLASNYSVGDKIIIRGMSDGNGQAIEKQEATIAGVDVGNNNITIEEDLDYSYKATYPTGDYEENFDLIDRTFITFMTFTTLSADADRGDASITVAGVSAFAVGDYIFFGDKKTPSDVAGSSTNTFRHEVNRIIDITGSVISLENAVCHDYETSYDAYIIKMDMVSNASYSGAVITYNAEPYAFTVNAFTIAYARDCYIKNCVVDNTGSYTSKGHGFRIDRAVNCKIDNCTVNPPQHIDAAEGYGFSIYRANHNIITNCKAYGCRHSYLLFRGASNNIISNIISVNARASDIDFHGGDEFNNLVEGFTIVGGDQKYGTNLAAIKFGNESHVIGCYHNMVKNGTVSNYKGFGIDFVPMSSNNIVENITFYNIERMVRCVDLSVDGTLVASNNIIRNCINDSQTQRIGTIDGTVNGGSSQIIDGLVVENCIFKNIQEHFRTFKNTINCKILNNIIIDAIDATGEADPYIIRAINSDNLLIQGNSVEKGTKFIKIQDCSDFVCKDNNLKDFFGTEVLDDVSGNNGYVFEYNNFEGFNETYAASGGGSSNGKLINKHQAHLENYVSEKALPLNITTLIPFDDTTPLITEGDEILTYSYTPKNTKSKIKIDCYVPAVYTDTATNVVLALFKDSDCISASGIRLPNTGTSSGHFVQTTAIADITSKSTFNISARLGPKTTGPTITAGGRFNGKSDPFLVIQELSYNPESFNLLQEDLAGFILNEDSDYIIQE